MSIFIDKIPKQILMIFNETTETSTRYHVDMNTELIFEENLPWELKEAKK